jgi:N-acetylglucosamine-6-phosphate deacetylase
MSNDVLITSAEILTESAVISRGWLRIRAGKIDGFGAGSPPQSDGDVRVIQAGGRTLLPGFIDVHVHGAINHDVMDADADGLRAMARFFAAHGVTGWLPTTLTATTEAINAALATVKEVMREPASGAAIFGVHLEGPYLNRKRGGAQHLDLIRPVDRAEALGWLETGIVRQISLAPEAEDANWLIAACHERGITTSAAHTDATYEQAIAGFDAGIRQSTHTFNAQSPLHHRAPGVVGAVLGDARVRAELIADGVHVHPGAMRALWAAKGAEGIILISDAMRATGMPDGDYPLGSYAVTKRGNSATLADGTLAGSVLTMDVGLVSFATAVGAPLTKVWRCASLNAAQAIGVADVTGSIAPGRRADLVLLGDDLAPWMTFVEGIMVYDASRG